MVGMSPHLDTRQEKSPLKEQRLQNELQGPFDL